jgi:hypothetical protein
MAPPPVVALDPLPVPADALAVALELVEELVLVELAATLVAA